MSSAARRLSASAWRRRDLGDVGTGGPSQIRAAQVNLG